MEQQRHSQREKRQGQKAPIVGGIKIATLVIVLLFSVLLTLSTYSLLPFEFPNWRRVYGVITGDDMYSPEHDILNFEIPAELKIQAPPKELNGETMRVFVLDVGQGSSTVITNGKNTIVVDCGENDKGGKVVALLKSLKIGKIDCLVITHPHSDHIGGADDVINKITTEKLIMPKLPKDVFTSTISYEDVLKAAKKNGVKGVYVSYGMTYTIGNISMKILAPKDTFDDINNSSAAVKISFGESSVLITGDAEKDAEQSMLKHNRNLKADIYIAGHHGSYTSSTDDFLDEVKPKYCAVSCLYANDYGHPSAETLKRLDERKIKVNRTDIQGTIVYVTDGINIAVATEK